MKKAEQLELRTRLEKIVETAIVKEGTCSAHSDFLGCAKALLDIANKQMSLIEDEDKHWFKLGVAWDSAFSPRYREAKEILVTIQKELPNAVEERKVEEDNIVEHQDGDEIRETTTSSSGDILGQSGEVEETKEVKKGWFGK